MGIVTSPWWILGLCFVLSGTRGQTVEFILRPQSVSVREGENVTFVCRLNTENPNIIWVKDEGSETTELFVKSERWTNNDRFSVVNQYDLVIADVRKEDNGVYSCRTKDAGIQTASLTVLLYPGPPSITLDVQDSVYTEGDVIKFTCSSTGGNPNPRITWLKNGNISTEIPEELPAVEVGGTSSSTITVTMDKSDHQANYSCLLFNELNVNNKLIDSVVLNVRYAPSIAFRPYSPVYTVRRGQAVEILCDVDANPPVTSVSWTRDGLSLSGITPKRSLSPASIADHGSYTCTATNSIGEGSGTLQLNVQYPPVLTVPPTVTVNEGEPVIITCQVEANPEPYEIQWIKVASNGVTRTVVNSAILSVDSVVRDSAGNYSCKALSQLRVSGESVTFETSESFTYLYVQYKPGTASIGPVPDVDVGERLDVTCTASPAGYPEANYIWTRDDTKLLQYDQTLTINAVSLSDNGRYSCTPNNTRGRGDPAYANVNVFYPPFISQEPALERSVFLSQSDLISFTCVAEGYPEPRVTWYQEGDNTALNSNARSDLFTVVTSTSPVNSYLVRKESVLQFKGSGREIINGQRVRLKIRDMGNYSCRADSDKHTDTPTASAQLLINFPPVLEDTQTRLAVSRLDSAQLVCAAQAYPTPTFQWSFQGRQVISGQQDIVISQKHVGGIGSLESKLTVTNVSDKSYGVYICLVINAIGNASMEISLSTKSPPEQPSSLRSVSYTWESVMLTWVPGFDGGYDQYFFIQKSGAGEDPQRLEVKPTSSTSFNVTKLRPSGKYTFQVVAANKLGYGPHSETVVVTTNDLQIPSLPEIPTFDAQQRKLILLPPQGNEYCLRVQVKVETGEWSPINGCMKVMGDTLEISHSGIAAVNVSVCLSHRTDVCGQPIAAEIHSSDKEAALTEEHVIIIACVCGVIIVTLLIVLFCFIFRRRRNAAKNYQGTTNQGDPPPYNSVAQNKKPQQQQQPPQVYDNQDNRLDVYPNRDGPVGVSPRSPTKDKYIDLQDRGGGELGLPDSSFNLSGELAGGSGPGGKPKKVIYEVVV